MAMRAGKGCETTSTEAELVELVEQVALAELLEKKLLFCG